MRLLRSSSLQAGTSLSVFVTCVSSQVASNATVSLSVPASPGQVQIVDANYQSYSIEFSYMQDYAGDASQPNTFSKQMLLNLQQISGNLPIIRAGGSTANRAVYYPSQTEAVILTFNTPGEDQPDAVSIGPAWMESFQQFPQGTQYIYNLNFADGPAGQNQTVLEAGLAYNGLGRYLYAYEIGNEVDGWPGGSRRPANWTIQSYVDQWLQYAQAIGDDAIGESTDQSLEPLFQGCAFEAPRNLANSSTTVWNVANAVRDGMATTGRLKTVADHEYMGAACAGAPVPTLADNLLNHFHMTSLMYYHEVLGNETTALGVPYVIGETNSISCQGLAGISDVFGAAIWSVDYILYGASSTKVSRMYFHNGTPYRYSAWQPTTVNGTAPYAKPLYYGNLFTFTALAGGNKQVVNLLNETSTTAYAIYNAGNSSAGADPALNGLAIVNLASWNETQPQTERPYIAFNLPTTEIEDWSAATLRRLTAPGVDSQNNITFAGQSVDEKGRIIGELNVEKVVNGTILVAAGEAVLVSL